MVNAYPTKEHHEDRQKMHFINRQVMYKIRVKFTSTGNAKENPPPASSSV